MHITAAKGRSNVAYIEIDKAPYLVLPPKEAFDRGERPINVDASNIVWVDPPGVPATREGIKLAYLWGSPQEGRLNGSFVKLPAGFSGELHSEGAGLRAVVIAGQALHRLVGESDGRTLEPGSYFGSKGDAVHRVACEGDKDYLLYVRTKGQIVAVPAQPKN